MGKDHNFSVKRWFSSLLLLGALLGLFAQAAAFAAAPAIPIADMAMTDDCAQMMGIDAPQPDTPCQGLTLDCIAKMGCALPFAVIGLTKPLNVTMDRQPASNPGPFAQMVGRDTGPEPDPPSHSG